MKLPPPHLRVRVSGSPDGDEYVEVGTRAARTMLEAVQAYATVSPVRRLLDWGCGPGRVAVPLTGIAPEIHILGCDVDAEAIAWANANVCPGSFAVNGLHPPLPYEDESFDAVIALSVMTHLDHREQKVWLREISRVLCPGGAFVASVHGEAFARSKGVTNLIGIQDHYINVGMTGVIPEGYYHDVLQTEAYTRYRWTVKQDFEVAAYEPASLELHDMVVLRKSGKRE
jgi:ubiquinone/menaquinone biosynthesis C-methylase UbiE